MNMIFFGNIRTVLRLTLLLLVLLSGPFGWCNFQMLKANEDTIEWALKPKSVDSLLKVLEHSVCADDQDFVKNFELVLISTEDYPKGRMDAFGNYAKRKYCLGELDSAIMFYKRAKDIAFRFEFVEYAFFMNKLGYLFQTSGDLDSSIHYFTKGLDFATLKSDSLYMGSMNVGIGTYYQHTGKIDSALTFYHKGLSIAEKIDNKELIITAKLNIATYHYDYQPEKLRISEFEDMLSISRAIGDRKRELSILEWLGYLHTDSGSYQLALEYFEEGISVNKEVKDVNNEILLLQGMSYTYNISGDNEKSIVTNNRIIQLALTSGYEIYLPSIYANNTTNFLALKKYEKAVTNAKKAIEAGEKSGQVELYFKVYKDMATAYAALGEFDRAYQSQKEFTRLSSEVLDDKKSKQIAELQTQYETEKKEAEIEKLSQQATIQALELRQKNVTIFIGVVLVALMTSGGYLLYRQRTLKTTQTQLELEQRFLRSQLNPHFISNALLAVQNFMLKNQPDEAAVYLSKFSKLMRETLENSRSEFIPLEDELQLLTHFMEIHKMRTNDSFDFGIHLSGNIEPEVDTIPPMFVQPFVENAIEHGLPNAKGQGQIDLYFEKEGDYISIVIEDNGGGYQESLVKKIDHTSLSSMIIQERIDAFNRTLKRKINLRVGDKTDEQGEIQGAKVELKVPFSYI